MSDVPSHVGVEAYQKVKQGSKVNDRDLNIPLNHIEWNRHRRKVKYGANIAALHRGRYLPHKQTTSPDNRVWRAKHPGDEHRFQSRVPALPSSSGEVNKQIQP
jgi:hypothetical protein